MLGIDNTYSGGTTISAGTLQIGNGGTTGKITGDVTDNGALVFSRSDAYTFGGLISGTGSLRQGGTGELSITSPYSGGTTSLPELGGGLSWDVSKLYVDGTIVAVPEPATLSLLALCGLAAISRKRASMQAM